MQDLHFGSGSVYGYMAHDTICLSEDRCSENFGMTDIISQEGLYGLQCHGVIGMSPAESTGKDGGDFFLDKLQETGTIDQKVFSLYINTAEDYSRITYGGYNLTKFAHPDHQEIIWHNLDGYSHHWELRLNKLEAVGTDLAMAFGEKVIVDSGTSLFLMPVKDRLLLVNSIA